jgi:hypothetical protein
MKIRHVNTLKMQDRRSLLPRAIEIFDQEHSPLRRQGHQLGEAIERSLHHRSEPTLTGKHSASSKASSSAAVSPPNPIVSHNKHRNMCRTSKCFTTSTTININIVHPTTTLRSYTWRLFGVAPSHGSYSLPSFPSSIIMITPVCRDVKGVRPQHSIYESLIP